MLRRFLDVCNAVAYAHARGVLHRDLKPGNVMLGEFGETLVVDWGLANVVCRREPSATETALVPSGSSVVETVVGTAVGTPAYMSPEQAEGRLEALEPATDVYSLGATLYCVLTGQAPIANGPLAEVLEKVRCGDIPPPRAARSDVLRALEASCLKAMALLPAERYTTVQEMARDVEHWLADQPVSAYCDPVWVRGKRWGRRNLPVVAAAAAAALVILEALGTGLAVVGGLNRPGSESTAEELCLLFPPCQLQIVHRLQNPKNHKNYNYSS